MPEGRQNVAACLNIHQALKIKGLGTLAIAISIKTLEDIKKMPAK